MARKEIRDTKYFRSRFGDSKMVEPLPTPEPIKNSKFHKELKKAAACELGIDSLAYKNILNGLEKEYNFFSIIFAQDKILGNGERICLFDDKYEISKKDSILLDRISIPHPQLSLYEKDSLSKENKFLLDNLVRNLNGYGVPYLITNPVLKKDSSGDNPYGFFIDIGNNTEIKTDKRFLNNNAKIKLKNGFEKMLLTRDNGIARIYSDNHGVFADKDLHHISPENKLVILNSDGSVKEIL